jgi:drug/metabolite transporter (DMT)-like permease
MAKPRGSLAAYAPELTLLVVVSLWASTFVLTKIAFAEISPLAFAFVRFAGMLALAFAVLAVGVRLGRASWSIRKSDWRRFALVGVCGYTLYQLGFVLGLERTSPFSSSLLIATVPLFTIGMLAAMGERPPRRAVLGVGIALLGAVIFLLDKWGAPGTLLGDALSVGSGISFAVYGLANRPLVRDYPTETYTAYSVLFGAVPLLAVSTPAALAQDWSALSAGTWVVIVYMITLPVFLAYILWNWAIARRGAAAASSFSLLVPVLSGAFSALAYGETFGPLKLLGGGLVVAGLVVINSNRK